MGDRFKIYRFAFESKALEGLGSTFIDIETRKVAAPEGWPTKQRWQTFMIGAAFQLGPFVVLEIAEGSEEYIINYAEHLHEPLVYSSFNDFDEMVLKGRFTSSRKPLQDEPGDWPRLHGSKRCINAHSVLQDLPSWYTRGVDCESKLVPSIWLKGDPNIVRLHCLRDVVELVLHSPGTDPDGPFIYAAAMIGSSPWPDVISQLAVSLMRQ